MGHNVILVSRIQNQLLNIIVSYTAWWPYLLIYLIDVLHCNLYYPDFMGPEQFRVGKILDFKIFNLRNFNSFFRNLQY